MALMRKHILMASYGRPDFFAVFIDIMPTRNYIRYTAREESGN